MKDAVSQRRVSLLHPERNVRKIFEDFVTEAENELNITLRVVQGLRTIDEQNGLYAQGRTKPGPIVTKAKGGQSYHNYGLAIDVAPLINNGTALDWNFKYELLLPIAKKYGLTWGGNFKSIKDKPHFELTFGNHWKTLLAKYNAKDFVKGTQYVKL